VSVVPGAEPFAHDGSDVGVLLIHGFSGSPYALRPWAEHLAARGHTVRVPRLPGHGTVWNDLAGTTWDDWYAEVERHFEALRERCSQVVVCGLSVGGALALALAERHGPAVAGLVLVNPAVRIDHRRLPVVLRLRHVLPSYPGVVDDIKKPGVTELGYARVSLKGVAEMVRGWKRVIQALPEVRQPLLLFRSEVDHVIPATSSALVLAAVQSQDVTEVVLHDSYHVATLDNDAPRIFEESVAFIERLRDQPTRPAQSGSQQRKQTS
jgi:carboxylesterase